MSINVWPGFAYDSLFDEAELSHEDNAIFEALGTQNFEVVLERLDSTIRIMEATGDDAGAYPQRRRSIAEALGKAVLGVHVPRSSLPDETLERLRLALRQHRWVFSTSYDLLTYYAAAVNDFFGFVDFFWNPDGAFDEATITLGPDDRQTRLLFLHGAVHLVVLGDGRTCKRKQTFLPLLDQFGHPHAGDARARPLMITEGLSGQKAAAIAANDYLSYASRMLRDCNSPLVVFGHSLSDQDQHLIDAINANVGRPVAISLTDQGRRNNRQRQYEIRARLESLTVYFFDAATHPFGSKDLRVPGASRWQFLRAARRVVGAA